jgi:hypothetical protein
MSKGFFIGAICLPSTEKNLVTFRDDKRITKISKYFSIMENIDKYLHLQIQNAR